MLWWHIKTGNLTIYVSDMLYLVNDLSVNWTIHLVICLLVPVSGGSLSGCKIWIEGKLSMDISFNRKLLAAWPLWVAYENIRKLTYQSICSTSLCPNLLLIGESFEHIDFLHRASLAWWHTASRTGSDLVHIFGCNY